MSKSYARAKGRRALSSFLALPHQVLRCPNYISLSLIARALLVDIANQYNGTNNGDLDAKWSTMTKRGWASKSTLSKHLEELTYYGFIIKVQQGGINVGGKKRPNLFAITWQSIDKIGFSDGFKEQSEWRVGQVPSSWKIEQPPLYPPKPKRRNPLELMHPKKN